MPLPTGSPAPRNTSNPGMIVTSEHNGLCSASHGPTDCRRPPVRVSARINIAFRHQRAPRDCQSRENLERPLQAPPLSASRIRSWRREVGSLMPGEPWSCWGPSRRYRYGRLASVKLDPLPVKVSRSLSHQYTRYVLRTRQYLILRSALGEDPRQPVPMDDTSFVAVPSAPASRTRQHQRR